MPEPTPNKRPRRAAPRQHPLDLFRKEGYSHQELPGSTSRHRVTSPAGNSYIVDLDMIDCTCPACKFNCGCKHLDAMRAEARYIEELVAAQPALYARAVRKHQK